MIRYWINRLHDAQILNTDALVLYRGALHLSTFCLVVRSDMKHRVIYIYIYTYIYIYIIYMYMNCVT